MRYLQQGDNKEQCSTTSSGIESEKIMISAKNTINKINIKSGDSPNKLAHYSMPEKEIQILEKPSPKTESEVRQVTFCEVSFFFMLRLPTIKNL